MGWEREGNAAVFNGWTADKIAERNEELAWRMRHHVPFHLLNGVLLGDSDKTSRMRESIADDLREAFQIGRRQWKGRMRDLALAGELVGAEGTYGALGAYPIPASPAAVTLSTTEALLVAAGVIALYMPIPQNGLLAPQAYRFVEAGVYTTTTTPGSVIFTPRIGNTTGAPSLGASAAIALGASLTNAQFVVKGDITIQSVGLVGAANSKALGHFIAHVNSALNGAANVGCWGTGTTAASFDSGAAAGATGGCFTINATDSGATNHGSLTVQQLHFMDWN